MRCLLAVDSGGTKCEAIAVGENGALLGHGRCGYTGGDSRNAHGGIGRSIESANGAVRQALRGVPFSQLHVAGYHRHSSLEDVIGTRLPGDVVFHPVHEYEGGLALAGLKHGIVASAGTGAFVHIAMEDGRHLHLDSLGPVLADCGSAYHIGMLAIQAAAKCDWSPRRKTSLKDFVYKALSLTETSPMGTSLIGIFERHLDRAVIASLAKLVDAEARCGDTVALSILDAAASALAETVYDAYDSMQLAGSDCTLVGTGSVIRRSVIYRDRLSTHISEFAPDIHIIWTSLPHVVGTALSVLDKVVDGDLAKAREKLIGDARLSSAWGEI